VTPISFVNGKVLGPDGEPAGTTLTVEGGVIVSVGGEARGREIDLEGRLILPGIVDLHGDAFERQIMPRPGVSFPLDLALQDTDAQLVANGVTTAYHGVTYSWEPGLRGPETTRAVKAAIEAARPHLMADTRFHLRHETHNLPAEAEVADWLESGTVDLLAFNDHSDMTLDEIENLGKSTATYCARTGLSHDGFMDLLREVVARKPGVPNSIARLAEVARANGIAIASHDDYTPEVRRTYHGLGARIAEFPMNTETAETAIALGDPVICGAPNVVRGGSHRGGLGIVAAREIREGRCTILVSDYYYPSLLQAPFRLAADGDMAAFGDAWRLVSSNPAAAAGLDDRGVLAPGRRADLLVVEPPVAGRPARIALTMVGGWPVSNRLSSLLA